MDTLYIFHVFNTLTNDHIRRALTSIVNQVGWSPLRFVLYNSSAMPTEHLLLQAVNVLGRRFREYRSLEPRSPTTTTLADIQEQISQIDGADFYFLHKADFVLADGALQATMLRATSAPLFLNFCKFDLRETVSEPLLLTGYNWERVMRNPEAVDLTDWHGDPADLRRYTLLGYRGWDGVMHAYTEAARERLVMDSFISPLTVAANFSRGITWEYGDTSRLAFHMFHALPDGRHDPNKDIPGERF